jgi:hypothetical protein
MGQPLHHDHFWPNFLSFLICPPELWQLTAETSRIETGETRQICGGQIGTGTGFSLEFFGFPVSTIPPWLSMLIYHLGDEQWAHW